MNVLLVYPEFPTSYWGFQYGMPLVNRKASLPPLGLVSLAALLPSRWDLRLVDLNVRDLSADDLCWADTVFVGGMRVQAPSIHEVLRRARSAGRRTVVGGPAPTTAPAEFADADIIFAGEAEGRIETLVEAVEAATTEKRLLLPPHAQWHAPIDQVPVPRYDLLDFRQYTSLAIQYSRGCPFKCEFCDIIEIFGRVPRVKTESQVLAELNALYQLGYRGSVFFVDDNFIANKASVKRLVPSLTQWQQQRRYPYEFYTEASVNLATDPELFNAMVEAGFSAVFLGIETPSVKALDEAGKRQNTAVDLAEAVQRLTRAGLEVLGGFIVGFDSDGPDIFAQQRDFISSQPLPMAMVGLLTALPQTALWRRLQREGRLRHNGDGHQFSRPNFQPIMNERTLLRGYARLLADLYDPAAFYDRCQQFVRMVPSPPGQKRSELKYLPTLIRTMWTVGVMRPYRAHFWRLLGTCLRHAPHCFAWAVGHAVMGEHLIRYTSEDVVPQICHALADLPEEQPSAALTGAQVCA